LAALLLAASYAVTQPSRVADSLDHLTASATLTFIKRDGSCVRGSISKADATTVSVQTLDKSEIVLQRDSLLQVSQGDALLFSARSSWADVIAVHVYPREALVLSLRRGKQVKGKPVKLNADAIVLRHGLSTTRYPKTEITAVDYLRVKPPSDSFSTFLEEAPYVLVFDPEFYYRMTGLEGRIAVRLYDATKPEDDTPQKCSTR
jgi:hypothetical protein